MNSGYDAWKLNPPLTNFAGRCPTCRAEYEFDSRPQVDEDGMPDYGVSTRPCVGCGVELCEACPQKRREQCRAPLCEVCAIHEPRNPAEFCLTCCLELVAEWAAARAARKEGKEITQ
ncbi:MAG TPA: hypothetical protein VLE22_23650 [Bryobacteraceae bacterium]|nr:hypothetical protein [Bryobacteraceae bacterium]